MADRRREAAIARLARMREQLDAGPDAAAAGLPWVRDEVDRLMEELMEPEGDDVLVKRAVALGAALDVLPRLERWISEARADALLALLAVKSGREVAPELNVSYPRVQQVVSRAAARHGIGTKDGDQLDTRALLKESGLNAWIEFGILEELVTEVFGGNSVRGEDVDG